MASDATLFVVDGDPTCRTAYKQLGESLSLKVQAFDSGNEFLNSYREDTPGCLISEFRVWDTSGLQIQHHLQGIGSVLPVIFVSSHGSVSLAVRAIQGGALEVFEKPADHTELAEAIQQGVRLSSHRLAQRKLRSTLEQQLKRLTRREIEVFEKLKETSDLRRIAAQIGVSRRTVQLCRQRIAAKLGLCSVEELFHVCQNEKQHDEACSWKFSAASGSWEEPGHGQRQELASPGFRSAS
jgi:FixJ family two-component response regulator